MQRAIVMRDRCHDKFFEIRTFLRRLRCSVLASARVSPASEMRQGKLTLFRILRFLRYSAVASLATAEVRKAAVRVCEI
jgi:hypothetical protein